MPQTRAPRMAPVTVVRPRICSCRASQNWLIASKSEIARRTYRVIGTYPFSQLGGRGGNAARRAISAPSVLPSLEQVRHLLRPIGHLAADRLHRAPAEFRPTISITAFLLNPGCGQ